LYGQHTNCKTQKGQTKGIIVERNEDNYEKKTLSAGDWNDETVTQN